MNFEDLAARIDRLESIESIKQLKARYLASCDAKSIEEIKNCFVEGDVLIDYGPVGKFTSREQLLELFEQVACHDYMVEMHHGQNPQVVIVSKDYAKAEWGLYYFLINTSEGTMTQLGGVYQDEYCRTAQGWKICKTVFTPGSSVVTSIVDGKPLFANHPKTMQQLTG